MIGIIVVENPMTRQPKFNKIITPLNTKSEPATFDDYVINAAQEPVSRHFIVGNIGRKSISVRMSQVKEEYHIKSRHLNAFARPKT